MGLSYEDYLKHYGVKGMRWGVRKDDIRSAGRVAKTVATTAADGVKKTSTVSYGNAMSSFYSKKSAAELQAEGLRNHKLQDSVKFPSKKGSSVDPPDAYSDLDKTPAKGLSTKQKVAIGVGAAATVGVLAYYGAKKYEDAKMDSLGLRTKDKKILRDETRKATEEQWTALFGETPTFRPDEEVRGFCQGLKNQKALNRPEFTIPEGTVFQRLSSSKETGEGYSRGAYSTFLKNDNERYSASVEFGWKPYTINYKAKGPVKVPSTTTVLDTLKKVMVENSGTTPSDSEVIEKYHKEISGNTWRTPEASKLIKELKKAGYSALVDDMDAGYMGDLPLVFFGETQEVTTTDRTGDDQMKSKASQSPVIGAYG